MLTEERRYEKVGWMDDSVNEINEERVSSEVSRPRFPQRGFPPSEFEVDFTDGRSWHEKGDVAAGSFPLWVQGGVWERTQ